MPSDTVSTQDPPTPPISAPVPEPSSIEQEWYLARFALRLLIILCLGALASFALTPYFLQPLSQAHTAVSTYTDGMCTAQPQTIEYVQKIDPRQPTPSIPPSWIQAGKNSTQFALAQACVAAFTIAYETIAIDNPASFTGAVSMLSSAGRKHFFEGTGTEPKDTRLDALWQAQARRDHLQQSAQVLNKAQLQSVLTSNGIFSAIFVTNYQLITTIAGKSTTQQKHMIIVLTRASVASSDTSTGWLVADWYDVPKGF